jgi:hypothetical protein
LEDVPVVGVPAAKKRKLENGTPLGSQPSFADVLERLKKEEGTKAAGEIYSTSLAVSR